MKPKAIGAKSSRYLSEEDRNKIQKAHKLGFSISNLAQCFDVNRSTVYRIIHKKTSTRIASGGRKPSTSKQDDDLIHVTLKKQCRKPLSSIQREDLPQHSYSLLQRRMKKFEMRQVSADVKPALNAQQRQARIDFAREFKSRRASFWRSVFFADECMVCDEPWKAHKKVICGENFPKQLIPPNEKVAHPARLMIWAGIKHGQPCRWTPVKGTMNSGKFVSVMTEMFPELQEKKSSGKVIVFQDNAPCHISREVSKFI